MLTAIARLPLVLQCDEFAQHFVPRNIWLVTKLPWASPVAMTVLTRPLGMLVQPVSSRPALPGR